MQKRGIAETTVRVLNPCAPVTDAEALAEAKLDDMMFGKEINGSPFQPLTIEWQYSSGMERENISLKPGQSMLMRESDAKEFLNAARERGLVSVSVDAGDADVRAASIQGIRRAITFYSDRGTKCLTDIRKLGYTKEELEERRHEYFSYHYNEALANALRAHLKTFEAQPAKKKVAA